MTPNSSVAETAAGSTTGPIGIIAIGHSALTGESSDLAHPGEPAFENSWATGDAPEVDSIYQRLVVVRPETQGHVANEARGGALVSALQAQASAALGEVPRPQLVIIQTVDNDIRCDGTDDDHIADFGTALSRALQTIVDQSPDSVILVVDQPGQPVDDADLMAENPDARAKASGTGPCDMFDPAGQRVEAHITELTRIIDAYEAEQHRVCASVPQCHTDGGVFREFPHWFADAIPGDWNHLTVHGQARIAEMAWPVVERVLGIA